jgi:hypothetical protein
MGEQECGVKSKYFTGKTGIRNLYLKKGME